jgi:hypothetical protein
MGFWVNGSGMRQKRIPGFSHIQNIQNEEKLNWRPKPHPEIGGSWEANMPNNLPLRYLLFKHKTCSSIDNAANEKRNAIFLIIDTPRNKRIKSTLLLLERRL